MRLQNLYINSQIINPQWSNSRVFSINTSILNYRLSVQDLYDSQKKLAWVLLVEQEPYVLHINLNYTNLGYKFYTTIRKNHMQKMLDAIIGEKQSVTTKNRTILNTFFMIRDVIDVPYKSHLALISLCFRELFTEQIGFQVLGKLVVSYVCCLFFVKFILLIKFSYLKFDKQVKYLLF